MSPGVQSLGCTVTHARNEVVSYRNSSYPGYKHQLLDPKPLTPKPCIHEPPNNLASAAIQK